QHVAEIMRAWMTMRRRAAAGRDVERDHHHLAAGDISERLLHELAHLGRRHLLLCRDGAEVEGNRERNEAEEREGGSDEFGCGHYHVILCWLLTFAYRRPSWPRLSRQFTFFLGVAAHKAWMAGTSPAMTNSYPRFNSLKKSLPLLSITMKAGKFST